MKSNPRYLRTLLSVAIGCAAVAWLVVVRGDARAEEVEAARAELARARALLAEERERAHRELVRAKAAAQAWELEEKRGSFQSEVLVRDGVTLRRGSTTRRFQRRWLPVDLGRLCVSLPPTWSASGDTIRDALGRVVTISAALHGPKAHAELRVTSLVGRPSGTACLSAGGPFTKASLEFTSVTVRTTEEFEVSSLTWSRDPGVDAVAPQGN